jgi:hypothetical protein
LWKRKKKRNEEIIKRESRSIREKIEGKNVGKIKKRTVETMEQRKIEIKR